MEWLEEELNRIPTLVSFLETPKERLFSLQKKEEKEILIEFNNIVNKISKIEEINPTLLFSKQKQKILINNILSYDNNFTFVFASVIEVIFHNCIDGQATSLFIWTKQEERNN